MHSSRLRKARWNLTLTLDEAHRNDEVIPLADSQVLRWVDELNGITDADERAREIKDSIKRIRREPDSLQNRRAVRVLYNELDQLQFKPDYMFLVIDRIKDYYRACAGFTINGIRYKRLLGTNGGIKNSTIVFASERIVDELRRRIDNDRDMSQSFVTAKLEAYKALVCSASNPVSMPDGVLVVDDAETIFQSDIIYLTDEGDGEPQMEFRQQETIEYDASDGYGLMLPSLAEKWSVELGLNYVVAGLNTRFAFSKGMVFTFDFLDFAKNVAENYMVKDVWGNEIDIRTVELVLTSSMVKLWSAYKSCDDFLSKSQANGYTFGITKTCPKELENERNTNYQFLQVFDLNDDDIEELIKPTIDEIKDVIGGDWRKTVLFLKGAGLNANNIQFTENDFAKAIMVDHRVLDDPFVQNSIYQLIRNRINQAKVGVVKVHGNYSMVSGDPYLLCQSIFGLEKTGLLKAGEIYNQYWVGTDELVCFRAPMSCANNVRSVIPSSSPEAQYWYRYMSTCTILNAWDTATAALNGCDFDGDLVMLTDNPVLVRRAPKLPTLMCAQRKATAIIPEEDDFIKSNIASFGNEIGAITNRVTSMYAVRETYPRDSKEYEMLSYRIMCGQLFQQNSIDKSKGIVAKPMPKEWYDRHSIHKIENPAMRSLYRKIVADKKPYFMRYIYPDLAKKYNTYIKNTNRKSLREFGCTVDELYARGLSGQEATFINYYEKRMPVNTSDCVMNKICRRFEQEFDRYFLKHKSEFGFNYKILQSGADYTARQYSAVKRLYEAYNQRLVEYASFSSLDDEHYVPVRVLNDRFLRECTEACPDRSALCDIIIDICYRRSATKRFAWSLCAEDIIHNLLQKNDGIISYPTFDYDGLIDFGGSTFRIEEQRIEVER